MNNIEIVFICICLLLIAYFIGYVLGTLSKLKIAIDDNKEYQSKWNWTKASEDEGRYHRIMSKVNYQHSAHHDLDNWVQDISEEMEKMKKEGQDNE